MKKTIYLLTSSILLASVANGNPVTPKHAQLVAKNFYSQNAKKEISSINIAYTGHTSTGANAYYAFNINENDGFVIVSADDAAQPVIGYSTNNKFVTPEANTTIDKWLSIRSKEIDFIQKNNLLPSGENAMRWARYQYNNPSLFKQAATTSSFPASVDPLVQTTWNQSPVYNAMCPHNSVTGCVATAMAQIMRYWSYPAHGTGSSSYCDCSADYFSNNYGTLSANYGAATYNWANMPLSVSSNNADVALLNYHCGVSVEMDYDPNGSGAWVITSDAYMYGNASDSACAQRSYVKYFNYDASTIQGLNRSDYDDSTWTNILKNDLSIGRPIQYVGDDPAEGGHTWVCDGYDENNYFHMNWGWGGFDNGWFLLDNLQTTNGTFNPSVGHEAVIGIVPIASYQADAAVSSISQPAGSYCSNNFTPTIRLQNFGADALTSCDIYYSLDNGAAQILNWSGSLITGQATTLNLPNFTATTGTHTLVCHSNSPNAMVDGNTANDQSSTTFNVNLPGGVLPFVEGFETCIMAGSSVWEVSHTNTTGADWTVTSNGGATGAKSCMIDNFTNSNGNVSTLQTAQSYDLTQFTSPQLSFKVAYQKKTTTTIYDHLQVLSSTDCGNGWTSRWSRTSATLSSGVSATPYIPAATDFTTYTISLNSMAQQTAVLFKWEFFADINAVGNNIYIDDINIIDAPSSVGINKYTANTSQFTIYPNPATELLNVSISSSNETELVMYDVLGNEIVKQFFKTQQVTLDVSALNSGIYFIKVGNATKKFVKQ